jgi:hypothetical protein
MTTLSMLDTADRPVPLPTGFLACPSCGIAVKRKPSSAVTTVEAMSRENTPPPSPGSNRQLAALRFEFLQCPPCADRRELAGRILDRPVPTTAKIPVEEITSWINRLAAPGAAAAWSSRFAPTLRAAAQPDTANPSPWAHVTQDGDLRREIRAWFAATLCDRVARSAPAVELRPPTGTAGCALCGVGSILMPASQVQSLGGRAKASSAAWTPVSVDPSAIGGRRSPDRVEGFTCPECFDAIDAVGSVGQSAMHRALLGYLQAAHRTSDAERLQIAGEDARLVGWAVAQRRVNKVPWGHLELV